MAAKKGDQPKKKKAKATVEQPEKSKYSIAQIKEFSGEVRNEFNKIVWPEKKVTLGSTGIVIVLVVIISVYLGMVDLVIGKLVGLILK